MKLIDLIAGARPNFMKIAPIIDALGKQRPSAPTLHYRLIHTGQHYDQNMSHTFFSSLGIPTGDVAAMHTARGFECAANHQVPLVCGQTLDVVIQPRVQREA